MKHFLLYTLVLTLCFSCSKDDKSTDIDGFSITGRLVAPNGADPIPNAKVSALKDGNVANEVYTNSEGVYDIALPSGTYELKFTKGKFKGLTQIEIIEATSVDDVLLDILPNIGVVTGHYDNIEHVLYNIGLVNPVTQEPLFDIIEGNDFARMSALTHTNFEGGHNHASMEAGRSSDNPMLNPNVDHSFLELMNNPSLLATYDILFLNCGLDESLEDMGDVLMDYVANGGILYATDWAAGYLNTITNGGTDYMTFYTPEKSGSSLTTTATLLDGTLSDWLALNFGIVIEDTMEIDEFLGSWQVVDSYNPASTISWLNGEVTYRDAGNNYITANKDLAFTFLHGNGAVFYSSFHTENNDPEFSAVDRVMEFFVFEMSDIE